MSNPVRAITKRGTTGSLSPVRCSCNKREHVLMKLAIEKTLIDAVVSFFIFMLRCVR